MNVYLLLENGYQLLFLSASSISQAYYTRQFLCNLKQDGKVLPKGPVVISPDGLFPSLYREVVRRTPHEFKIACLEDMKALFPADRNPFYAGFENRDTDEIRVELPQHPSTEPVDGGAAAKRRLRETEERLRHAIEELQRCQHSTIFTRASSCRMVSVLTSESSSAPSS